MPNAATNETAAAATSAAGTLSAELCNQLSHGQELWNKVATWTTEHGLSFAIRLLAAAVILIAGAFAIRLVVAAVGRAVERSGRGKTLFATFAKNVTSKVCWAVLIVTVLGKLGVDIGPVIAGLGVTGFILGFAFQESLGNLASGLMVALNQPFKIGDYVVVAGLEGTVLSVDMMATTLATADNKKVVIPNKSAWGGPITNFSALGRRRVDIKIGIDYASDVGKAIEIALKALASVPGVLKDPAPSVSVASLDDSQVTLNVRPWSNGGDYWAVYNATCQAVKAEFERSGINIPFPQLTVHMDNGQPA
ncbi:MAG: mechanosensitive ion channel family protein [Kiritimatiellae bacterium]|nr:mechanosensitive ion channel family protein [Kiritimatiellia bacterium]